MGSTLVCDTLIGILTRLPEKSLCRFKCVSKQWYSLIHDDIHQRRLPITVIGLFHHDLVDTKFPTSSGPPLILPQYKCNFSGLSEGCHDGVFPNFLPLDDQLLVLDCCNGLLLCRPKITYPIVFVVNPATKRWRQLPEFLNLNGHSNIFILAFDPWVSPHYKIVHFLKPDRELSKVVLFDVFDSSKCKWSETKPFPADHIRDLIHGAFLGGALYLISAVYGIVRFDLAEGNYCSVHLPMREIARHESIAVYLGKLWHATCDGSWLTVCVLKDWRTREWTLKVCTSLEELAKKYPEELHSLPTQGMLKLLAFHPYLEVVFLQMGLKIFSYDLNSLMLKNTFNLEPETLTSASRTFIRSLGIFPFSPCLIDLLDDADMGNSM